MISAVFDLSPFALCVNCSSYIYHLGLCKVHEFAVYIFIRDKGNTLPGHMDARKTYKENSNDIWIPERDRLSSFQESK